MIETITFELVKYFLSNLGHKVNLFSSSNLFKHSEAAGNSGSGKNLQQ